ncbi:MAG: transglycosylase domain-containing protein, partial [Bacteroidetes bacterium]|nr:transglycosylase domain-containing protein [Bacteroidota bacterium]
MFWFLVTGCIVFIALLFLLISLNLLGYMPDVEELEKPRTYLATQILSSDQELLGLYYNENRTVAELGNLSRYLFDALIATEDARFFDHCGIDGIAVLAIIKSILAGNPRGGSTITQQLAKNLLKTREKSGSTFIAKLKEWVIAVRLERRYNKEEIITMYLNTVEYGSNAFGINAASQTYFRKKPDELKIEEAAVLIGVLKGTTLYNPKRNPDKALGRRNTVLNQMRKYDYISQAQYDSLSGLPLKLDYSPITYNTGLAPYFREYLRKYMKAKKPGRNQYKTEEGYESALSRWKNDPLYGWCNKNNKPNGDPYDLNTDGLKIFTTVNSRLQSYAEEAVARHLGKDLQPAFDREQKSNRNSPFSASLSKEQSDRIMQQSIKRSERYLRHKAHKIPHDSIMKIFGKSVKMSLFSWNGTIDTILSPCDSLRYMKRFLRSGFLSVEPQTGYVRAYVGGIDYTYFKYDHITKGKRQVGSTFKPFIYSVAMANRESPCTKYPNIETVFTLANGKAWSPAFSHTELDGKMVSLKQGLAFSMNQISAALLKKYGSNAVIKAANALGVRSHIEPYPSLCVGSPDISLYEMVAAYSAFANKGVYIEPVLVTRIEDRYGNVISTFKPVTIREAVSEETAYLTIDLMRGVVLEGTSTRLRWKYGLKNDIAGKTGTTNNNSDGWFIGLTPELVSGAWVGGEERSIRFKSTILGQGANMALPIWSLYMQQVYNDKKLKICADKFEEPENLSVETDCEKYERER